MRRARVDPFALIGGVLAVAMAVVYVAIMRQQQSEPAAWVLVALAVGATASCYGAVVSAPYRRVALGAAAAVLMPLGLLAILTIGVPIIAAGVLALVAAARQSPVAPEAPAPGPAPAADRPS